MAQSRSIFVPYAADRDEVSAIGVCLKFGASIIKETSLSISQAAVW